MKKVDRHLRIKAVKVVHNYLTKMGWASFFKRVWPLFFPWAGFFDNTLFSLGSTSN
jgi:hypothetical protein